MSLLLLLTLFTIAAIATNIIVPRLARAAYFSGFFGVDLHKDPKMKIPGLGGIAIGLGMLGAIIFGIMTISFASLGFLDVGLNPVILLAVFASVLMTIFIGLMDDILDLRKYWKFGLSLMIALPLIAIRISSLHPLSIPFLGVLVEDRFLYGMILIPIGIVASTNLTNTFAGFNGMEASLGLISALFLLIIGILVGNIHVQVLSVILAGALFGFYKYSAYPSKIFPDDIGTLLIGAMIGSIVVIGGIELAGVILLGLYIIDFMIFKIPNRFPSTGWQGTLRNGKLYCDGKPIHLAQWVMKESNGITEKNLVLTFVIFQIVLGLTATLIYVVSK